MANSKTLFESVIGFAAALRRAGVPVSVGEYMDAVRGVSLTDLLDRDSVRTSLCATLVKRKEHLVVFEAIFAEWFRAAQHEIEGAWPPAIPVVSGRDPMANLPDALREGNRAALRAAAVMAVWQFGGLDREQPSSVRHHLYRVLRQVDLTRMLQEAMAGAGPDDRDDRQRLREHVAEFRRMLSEEVEALRARRMGDEESCPPGSPDVDDVDFIGASPAQLAAMRDAVRPLVRRLATRLARRRQLQRKGRVDVRRTARRSLSSGGVPIDPAFRRPLIHHPDLFVLCDLSGSVAEFAKFTITLLHALSRELPRTRLFVFVDGLDEVTGLVRDLPATLDVSHLLATTEAVGTDGHSDYGAALARFWTRYGREVTSTSAVIIAGDGRTNYRDPGTASLRLIHERARRLYWLNPEPQRYWGTTDSRVDEYRNHCDQLVEVRNLRQLSDFVYRMA